MTHFNVYYYRFDDVNDYGTYHNDYKLDLKSWLAYEPLGVFLREVHDFGVSFLEGYTLTPTN